MVIDNGSTFVKELVDLICVLKVEVDLVTRENFVSGQEAIYDFVVLSGGHLANTNVMENLEIYTEEIKVIKNSGTPILGICLGHQLIASAFESEVYRIKEKVRGVFPLTNVINHPIMEGVHKLDVFEAHQYAVRKVLAPLFSIAESKTGVEILGVSDRKIIGFQFHPEMNQSENGGKQFLRNFIKMIA